MVHGLLLLFLKMRSYTSFYWNFWGGLEYMAYEACILTIMSLHKTRSYSDLTIIIIIICGIHKMNKSKFQFYYCKLLLQDSSQTISFKFHYIWFTNISNTLKRNSLLPPQILPTISIYYYWKFKKQGLGDVGNNYEVRFLLSSF